MAQPPYGPPSHQAYRPPHPPYGRPPRRKGRGWLVALLIAAGLALVLVVAIGFVVGDLLKRRAGQWATPPIATATGGTQEDDGSTGDTKSGGTKLRTVAREGYHDLSDGVADPAPLVERDNRVAMRYRGTAVIPACALLTIAELNRHDLLLTPNPLGGAYQRSVFDGQGRGNLEKGSELFFPVTPPNSCQYVLTSGALVRVEVFQKAYTFPSAMVYEFKRYSSRPAIGGVSVRRGKAQGSNKEGAYFRYGLRLGDTAVRLSMTLPAGTQADRIERALLMTVATNLKQRSARPVGTTDITYDSPLLTSPPALPCAAFRAEDFRTLFRRPAAPVVHEMFGSAVGRLDFSIGETGISDAREYGYTYSECKRFTGEDTVNRHTLTVTIASYTADAGAEHAMKLGRPADAGKPLRGGVAAEAYCVTRTYSRTAGALVIRQGRHVMAFSMIDPNQLQDSVDLGKRCESMRGMAERVASRLKG